MGKARSTARRGKGKRRQGWRRWVLCVVILVALEILVLEIYHVPDSAMANTLLEGDVVAAEALTMGLSLPVIDGRLPAFRDPAPGQVLLFAAPDDASRTSISRCVAAGGQTLEIRNKAVFVDGARLADPTFSQYRDVRILPASQSRRDNLAAQRLPERHFFALGDNRDRSRDSRQWGSVASDGVRGRVLRVLWSVAPKDDGEASGSWLSRVRWSRFGTVVE